MSVAMWFAALNGHLLIDQVKRSSFATRTRRITRVLNLNLRSTDSETANSFYVGSYGRNTAIPSVSDIDLLYHLPVGLYHQYNAYAGNGQSALLGAVRAALLTTYPNTKIAGDGQVVVIEFTDNVKYEVLPAFLNEGGGYTFADSNHGGSWRGCHPKAEMEAFAARNATTNQNLVFLGRMAREWRNWNSVSMSGMLIDTLAYQFMETWPHRDKSFLYHDYLTRDFFHFVANQPTNQSYWRAPGSGSYVYGGEFHFKARQGELRALEAIDYLAKGQDWSAKQKFREIYGPKFPA